MKYNKEVYRGNNEVELTPEGRQRIIEALNVWSNSIKFSPVESLGSKVEFTKVTALNAYLATISTQTDRRHIHSATDPFAGGKIPPLVSSDPSNYHVWDFKFDRPSGFVNSQESRRIDGTQRVATCTTCKGKKENTCSDCRGTKVRTCGGCGGRGRVAAEPKRCSSCGGSGSRAQYREERYITGYENGAPRWGTRTVTDSKSCGGCGGQGTVDGGEQSCSSCGGSGKRTCSTCNGKGVVTCVPCRGNGSMVHYLAIHRSLVVINNSGFFSFLTKAQYSAIFPKLGDRDWAQCDRYDATDGPLNLDFNAIPCIGENTQKLVDKNHLNQGPKEKILHETLIIQETQILKVDYRFDSQNYTAYITQCDNVIAPSSPISQYSDRLMERAKQNVRWRSLYWAYNQYNQLYHLSQYRDDVKDMRDQIAVNMRADMIFGQRMMFYFLILIMLPLNTYYLTNISYVAQWVDIDAASQTWLWSYLPYLYTFAVLRGGYAIAKRLPEVIARRIPTFALRALCGAVTAVVFAYGLNLLIFVAHALITPTLVQTLVQIIYSPISLFKGFLNFLF